MEHDPKIDKVYYDAVKRGKKTFEIRFNDREYQKGDTVTLTAMTRLGTEWIGAPQLKATIGYVTGFKQQEGYVVFSLLAVTLAS